MKLLDCTQLFDIGEKITLSSDFLSHTYTSDSWEQDCINTQIKQGSLEIINVNLYDIRIKGIIGNWTLGISDIYLYQLEPYKDNYEILMPNRYTSIYLMFDKKYEFDNVPIGFYTLDDGVTTIYK